MNIQLILCAALGGAIGSVARYVISNRLRELSPTLATLLVNLLGSFLIGVLAVYVVNKEGAADYVRALIMVGLLGGFTTFSSFSLENFQLLKAGAYSGFVVNVGLQVVGGVALFATGWFLGMQLFKS